MAKYRKKPVVVEAEAYRPGLEDGLSRIYLDWETRDENSIEYRWFISPIGAGPNGDCLDYDGAIWVPYINTLEGRHYISPGDYIITGVKGERYPCKPDIFKMTYELACEDSQI